VGLAAARNTRPVLLQSYLRDVGGSRVRLNEVDVPIHVNGRRWAGLRLTYRASRARAPQPSKAPS
jgi:methyl-accepting chemotaxis protein